MPVAVRSLAFPLQHPCCCQIDNSTNSATNNTSAGPVAGNYFKDTLSALKFYPSWVTAYGLAQRAGVDKVLASTKDPYTLFVPNVKAWKPVELKLEGASAAQLAEIFKYHVVLGALQVGRQGHQAATNFSQCT